MSVPLITISQLAAYAGVTVRAVRHYHKRGLLPEPERDVSGYRRYDAQAVIKLIRIKTLADAGVPLSRVGELLETGPEEFAAATAEIDRDLRAQIRQLKRYRERVASLDSVERLALPSEVADYLERLRALGGTERGLAMERDLWVLIAAQFPDEMPQWMEVKNELLDDPVMVRLAIGLDQAHDWPPDDPRLAALADDFVAYLATFDLDQDEGDMADDTLVALLDNHILQSSPSWQRFAELLEERGWTGWTQMSRADTT